VQVLSDLDLEPDLEGDLRLTDGEGGAPTDITANSIALRKYRDNLHKHNEGLADSAKRGGGRYAIFETSRPLDRFIQDTLKREGWLS
jgi:hypothetical protein